MKRAWTSEEDAVLRRCYPEGGAAAVVAALATLGVTVSPQGVRNRAFALDIARRTGIAVDRGRGGLMPMLWPTYTARQRRALERLAESRPTPEHYRRERARILGRST